MRAVYEPAIEYAMKKLSKDLENRMEYLSSEFAYKNPSDLHRAIMEDETFIDLRQQLTDLYQNSIPTHYGITAEEYEHLHPQIKDIR